MKRLSVIAALCLASACVVEATDPEGGVSGLVIETQTDTEIAGSFVHAGSVIDFQVRADGPEHAALVLDVNGATIDVELDLATQSFRQDGHLNALYEDDLAALVALRDALEAELPELVESTLHGKLLARHADHLGEAPVGHTLDVRTVDMRAAVGRVPLQNRAAADGCGGDGVTCLRGSNGYDYAVYDPGNNGTCVWEWARYGTKAKDCNGRCGAGCSWWDKNYTWDCFDHDRCVDAYGGSNLIGNSNCGDEFEDAVDDYVVTYNPWAC